METKKILYYEAMRVAACFFVIFNHTGTEGFFLFSQYEPGTVRFWVYLFVSVFCKFSVPLFFAISGALMLGREKESLQFLWKKRILKIIIILIVVSSVYYMEKILTEGGAFSIKMFIKKLYVGNVKTCLWYLYAYIAYLMSIPFLKTLVQNLEDKFFYYMFGIGIFWNGIVPVAEYLLWQGKHTVNGNLRLDWLVSTIILYPCLGYFLEHRLDIRKIQKRIGLMWAVNIAFVLISCGMTYYKVRLTGVCTQADSQGFHSAFTLVNCASVFVGVKYLAGRLEVSKRAEKWIYSLGSCTFGIYLLHQLVKDRAAMKYLLIWLQASGMNDLAAVFLWCLVIMLVSYVITLLLKKIPLAGRWI